MKPVLDVHVITTDAVQLDAGPAGSVVMIPFHGTVTGTVFEGVVEPCGVDTQVLNPAGVRRMSARYMLTGHALPPYEGDCHIYIENNGWSADGEEGTVFKTVPTFLTDSAALAPYLHRNCFIGEGIPDEQGVLIRLYEALENHPDEK